MTFMRKSIITLGALFFATLLSLSAAEDAKGLVKSKGVELRNAYTVDMGDVYSRYDKAIKAQEEYQNSMQVAQDEFNKMTQDLRELGEEAQKLKEKSENEALTEDAQKAFRAEAEQKAVDFQKKQIEQEQFANRTNQTLTQRSQTVMNLHLGEIDLAVGEIAKERGADIVFNSTKPIVMYQNESKGISLTEDVVKALNKTEVKAIAAPPSGKK